MQIAKYRKVFPPRVTPLPYAERARRALRACGTLGTRTGRASALVRWKRGAHVWRAELERALKDPSRHRAGLQQTGETPADSTGAVSFRRMYGALGLDEETCERLSVRLDEPHERHLWRTRPEAPAC